MGKLLGALVVVVVVGFLIIHFLLPNFHLGAGDGNGDSNGTNQTISSEDIIPSVPTSPEENSNSEIEIRIEGNDIYFDGELCKDVEDLKQKIIDTGTEPQYKFISDNALKGTYDDVQAILSNLETALEITVVEN